MADEERDDQDRAPQPQEGLLEGHAADRRRPAARLGGLLAIITWGGWDTLEGAKPLQIAYIVLYLLMAFFVLRWSRGVLPVAAALAIIMLIFAAVSAPAVVRPRQGRFHEPGARRERPRLLTALMVPLQILLIAFAMSGFRQAWNVEVEHSPEDDDRGRDEATAERAERGDASPAPAFEGHRTGRDAVEGRPPVVAGPQACTTRAAATSPSRTVAEAEAGSISGSTGSTTPSRSSPSSAS